MITWTTALHVLLWLAVLALVAVLGRELLRLIGASEQVIRICGIILVIVAVLFLLTQLGVVAHELPVDGAVSPVPAVCAGPEQRIMAC